MNRERMKYAWSVAQCARVTVRNPFAVLLVSVGTTLSVLPFATGVLVAGTVGGLIGLWTTSIMLGFVAVGGARIAVVTLEREVSLGTDYFWEGMKTGTIMGPAVGIGTFAAALVAIVLFSIPAEGVVGMSLTLVGLYVLIAWFVLATFALTLWASFENPRDVRTAFVEGGTLILEEPSAAAWLVVQAIGWTLLAVPLIIAPVLILPGFVQMIGTAIVRVAVTESSSHPTVVTSDEG